jgi:hypothetical protein
MKQWERYQHQAAELLRELGFSTEVTASLTEPNGAVHEIDVAARRTVELTATWPELRPSSTSEEQNVCDDAPTMVGFFPASARVVGQ